MVKCMEGNESEGMKADINRISVSKIMNFP